MLERKTLPAPFRVIATTLLLPMSLALVSAPVSASLTKRIEAMHIDNDGVLDLWVAACDGNRVFMAAFSGPGFFSDGFESGDTSAWSATVP